MITLPLLTSHNRAWLHEIENDPEAVGEFGWFGYRPSRQPDQDTPTTITDTTGRLAVVSESGDFVGAVAWSQANHGPNGQCPNVGAMILPSLRGRGYGTAAQRALAEYLFPLKPVARVEASTEVGNLADRRHWKALASSARVSPASGVPGGYLPRRGDVQHSPRRALTDHRRERGTVRTTVCPTGVGFLSRPGGQAARQRPAHRHRLPTDAGPSESRSSGSRTWCRSDRPCPGRSTPPQGSPGGP